MFSSCPRLFAAFFTILLDLLIGESAYCQNIDRVEQSNISAPHSVCSRTPQVQLAIRRALLHQGLDLSCDQINYIDLARIREIDLSHMELVSLRTFDFEGLLGVQTLDLSHNALTTLPVGLFSLMPRLMNLSLAFNRLNSFHWLSPETARKLEILDISSNHISADVPLNALVNLTRLHALIIGGNPLDHDDAAMNRLALTMSRLRHRSWTYSWADELRDSGIFSENASRSVLLPSVSSMGWLPAQRAIQEQAPTLPAQNSIMAIPPQTPGPDIQPIPAPNGGNDIQAMPPMPPSDGGSYIRSRPMPRSNGGGSRRPAPGDDLEFGAESGGGGFMEGL